MGLAFLVAFEFHYGRFTLSIPAYTWSIFGHVLVAFALVALLAQAGQYMRITQTALVKAQELNCETEYYEKSMSYWVFWKRILMTNGPFFLAFCAFTTTPVGVSLINVFKQVFRLISS